MYIPHFYLMCDMGSIKCYGCSNTSLEILSDGTIDIPLKKTPLDCVSCILMP